MLERDIVRSYRDDIPVLTNFMRFYRRADYWRWAAEEDAAALDIYPDPGQADAHVAAAFNFDLMRSLRGEPWLLMEQAASAVSQWRVNNVKRPGRMRLGSYQAIAHGADSVLFFQWRASRGGHERFHSAMLPHSGTAARSWQEVEALGTELPKIAEAVGSGTDGGGRAALRLAGLVGTGDHARLAAQRLRLHPAGRRPLPAAAGRRTTRSTWSPSTRT